MAYTDADRHPPRPVVFEGDFPSPTESVADLEATQKRKFEQEALEAHPSIEFEWARHEREELLRRAMAGHTAQQVMYPREPEGALSPREEQRCLDYQEAARHHMGGLPDSPEDMPAVSVIGGSPVRFD